jgi:hypothetical protein
MDFLHQLLRPVREFLQQESVQQAAPTVAFVGGFTWDALTLSRIDRIFDLSILTGYLIVASALMVWIGLEKQGEADENPTGFLKKAGIWIKTNKAFLFQFFIGGLFSAFVIFIFKSVTFSKSAIFFGLVIGLFVLNEFGGRRFSNWYLRVGLMFVAVFMYLVFVLPLILDRIDYVVFVISAVVALVFSASLLFWIHRKNVISISERLFKRLGMFQVALALLLLSAYNLHLIPPVPLVLKEAMLATHVARNGSDYDIRIVESGWWNFWRQYETRYVASDTLKLYCFASVFAPGRLQETLVHEWQRWDETKNVWVTSDRIPYVIKSGRELGYRGFTFKSKLRTGKWRVSVKTNDERLIGRMGFEIVPQ